MTHRLHRLFRIVPGEGTKVLVFSLFAGLLQAGVAVGISASDALFLTHLGVQKLPLVYICMPVIMAVYAPSYAVLQGRFGVDRVFSATLVLLIAGGLFFGIGVDLFGESTPWVLFSMKLYVGLWYIALYTLYWNFADDYFSIRDSKRLYGIIAAGSACGAMLGFALVAWLTTFLPPAKLFLLWSALALLTLPVFITLRRRFPRIETEDVEEEGARHPARLLLSVLDSFKASRFALALTAICFCTISLTVVMEYLTMGILAQGQSAAELAGLLGKLHAMANALTLIVNLFLFNRIVGRLGVNNTVLILPLAYLGAFVFFFLNTGTAAALVAFFAYQSILVSVDFNNVNLLFNALPASLKRQLRTFIEAMCEPGATALVGVCLLSWAALIGDNKIALSGLLATVIALGIALLVRHDYVRALAVNLRRDWLDFTRPEAVSTQDRAHFLKVATESPDRTERILAADLLGFVDDSHACEALLTIVGSASSSEVDRLRPAIRRMIQSGDTATIAKILLWLESEEGPKEPELLDEFTAVGVLPMRLLQRWRDSRHPSHIAVTAISRWHSSRIEETQHALNDVGCLLAGDATARRWGVRALGTFRQSQHARELFKFLEQPEEDLRLETLRALARMAGADSRAILENTLPLLAEASAEERALILGIASKVGDEKALTEILLAAEFFSAVENRQLEELAIEMGLKTVPVLIHLIRNPAASHRSRSIAARTLSQLAMPQLELIADELIEESLIRATECAKAAQSLVEKAMTTRSRGLLVLTHFYADSASDTLDFILQLLSLTGRLPDFDLIRASLAFSNPRDRANAIETIEQSCPRKLFEGLLPLIKETRASENEQPQAPLSEDSFLSLLQRAAQSDQRLECVPALLACQELGIPEGNDWLHQRLAQTKSARSIAWLLALRARSPAATDRPSNDTNLHPIEVLACFLCARIFEGTRIFALDYLAARSTQRAFADGTLLYVSEKREAMLYVIVSGSIEITRAGRRYTESAGGHCNESVLMGKIRRDEQALSRGCVMLEIPATTMTKAIGIFPALGMSLYRIKLAPDTA